ncbi:MAG: ABC transporter permease [Acidimicrobiia bacterium]|nr:ABC transporter permease [Acidimicrobiia bacterium]
MLTVVLRGIRSHVLRLAATVVAIVLAVGFMVGTQLLGATLRVSFDEAFADINQSLDAVVRASREMASPFGGQRMRIDAATLEQVRAVPGVAAAAGEVRSFVRVVDDEGRPIGNPDSGPPTFGLNWIDDPRLNAWTLVEGDAPHASDTVVVDLRTAEDAGVGPGDTLVVDLPTGAESFTVSGVARFGELDNFAGADAVLFEDTVAQQALGEPDRYDWIAVAGDAGIDETELVRRLAPTLPPGTEAVTGATFTEETAGPFREFIVQFTAFIGAFGLIALFVGGFIIYNTFAVLVGQRTRELALLRVVGASRSQVLGSVLAEALLVGVVAAVAGVAAGFGLAAGLRELLAAFGFALPPRAFVIEPWSLAWPALLAVGVTVLSALVPARRAAAVAPVAAFGQAAVDRSSTSRLRLVLGLVLVAVSVERSLAGLRSEGETAFWNVGGALICAFLATAVLGPLVMGPLATVLGAPLRRLTGVTGHLATENARRNPARTSITASALTIGVGLVVVIAIAADSASASITNATEATFDADLVVRPDSFLGLSPQAADDLEALEEVATAAGFRFAPTEVLGTQTTLVGIDPSRAQEVVDFGVVDGSLDDLGSNSVAVSAREAERFGLSVGDLVPMAFVATGDTVLQVTAIFEGNPLLQRSARFVVDHDTFDANHPPSARRDAQIALLLAEDTSPVLARAAVDEVLTAYPGAESQDLGEVTAGQAATVDQAVAFLYALLFLAVLIALIGVVNTLLLAVYERTRELGLLRAVGTSRRQVRAMVIQESVVIAVVGTLVGVAIGMTFGRLLFELLARESRAVTTFSLPTTQLLATVVLAALAGVLAAVYPARRAARLDVLDAIATE